MTRDRDGAPLSKPAARGRAKAVRAELGPAVKSEWDRRIIARCQDTLAWEQLDTVHMFVPIVRMKEIDTWPLLNWLWQLYPALNIYVPRVTGKIIEHVRVDPQTQWEANAFGIPEPSDGEVLDERAPIDAVIVPLLACDGQGCRVGYGGGYYDRFLSEHPEALRVGLVYDACVIAEGIQIEPYDVPLQMVITDRAVFEIRA